MLFKKVFLVICFLFIYINCVYGDTLVLFYSTNCPACKKLDKILDEKNIKNELAKIPILRYNIDKKSDMTLMEKIRQKSKLKIKFLVPQYYILDDKSEIIKGDVGYKSEKEFLEWLSK